MNTLTNNKSSNAVDLSFSKDFIKITFEDARQLSVPLEWFPRLRNASKEDLNNWRFIGDGEGIHWESLDEDILIENLLI
ncbi:DUF2442 domain-containing protein [Aequorivita echinoideorum]|uniref:DUF2442 domain-containing protein n=1 Tax=Aequorivita echinoideorum TaxID=1549647 RepID=A0ABS5S3J0_9FLAO|nr:DUF2442 domain-containing protein [Aequorivita echinoideorum]MBT0606989.1 DUF2442 domain-containing protein [Aequorivita echinoideorum]